MQRICRRLQSLQQHVAAHPVSASIPGASDGTNWAGNIHFSAPVVLRPGTVTEVQAVVRETPRLRVVGSRHSFSRLADSPEVMVSLERMCKVLRIETPSAGKSFVTVEGGITYGQLCPVLEAAGLALHNLASLPHISVAGAVATGTHGSGMGNGNLATSVVAVELVVADGSLVTLSRDHCPADFAGAVTALGALGVVVSLTLEAQPRFDMSQVVYGPMPLASLASNFEQVMGSDYSVSVFTNWASGTAEIWCKRRLGDLSCPEQTSSSAHGLSNDWSEELCGAPRKTEKRHPIPELDASPCTDQLAKPGPWHDRLPHFRFDNVPSVGEEIQAEYFVPIEHGPAVINLLASDAVSDKISGVLQISELRCIAADEMMLSPHYKRPALAVHFTLKRDWPGVRAALQVVDEALRPFSPRPHMGKVFTLPPSRVQAALDPAALSSFRALVRRYDPQGKFQNDWVQAYIFNDYMERDEDWYQDNRVDGLHS